MTRPTDFGPPTSAASLYCGPVMHARMKPVSHRFTYQVYSLLIDVGRLDEADRLSPVFSVSRWNLLSFSPRDHGPRDGSSLQAHVETLLAKSGLDIAGGRVLLFCYPRVLGFVFNPLSIYYCYDAQERLAALVYEVRNTFGESHSYVAPLGVDEAAGAGVRQERDKLFYVSPFLDMTMRYHFRLQPPGETLRVRILETDADGPILAATFSGAREEMRTGALLKAFVAMPLLTFKIVGAIHYEALRLWMKGLRLKPRPAPPEAVSYRGANPEPLTPANEMTPR